MSIDAGQAGAVEVKEQARGRAGGKSGLKWARLSVQIVVAAFVLLISVGHTLVWSWTANLHTICPLGGVVNIYTYFSPGGYVAKLHSAVFIMLLALVIGLVLTGKSFCGWICPLGTVQELLGKAGKRLWPRLYNRVPLQVERVLRYGKYVMLIWIVVQTARSAKLFFESFDPYYNLFSIWSDEIAWIGYVVVGGVLLASLFIERPFSRYACPLGALNGFFNSFSLLQIKRDTMSCTDCGRCDKACPVNIKVSQAIAVRHAECTRCLQCVEACPVNARTNRTLKLRTIFPWTRVGSSPVSSRVFASVAVLAFALPIGITIGTGDFVVTTKHVYTSPADIKGSSPLSDIVKNFSVSEAALYNGIGIPDSVSPNTLMKDLASAMGVPEGEETVSPETIRTIITYLDSTLAVFVTQAGADQATITEAAVAAGLTDASTVRDLMEQGPSGAVLRALKAEDSTTVTSEGTLTIKGSTTLGQLEGMVADYQALLGEFGIDASEPGETTLRELAAKYGLEVDDIRTYVQGRQ